MKQPEPISSCVECSYSIGTHCAKTETLRQRLESEVIPSWCPLEDAVDTEKYEQAGYKWWVKFDSSSFFWNGEAKWTCYVFRDNTGDCMRATHPTKREAEQACIAWLTENVKEGGEG